MPPGLVHRNEEGSQMLFPETFEGVFNLPNWTPGMPYRPLRSPNCHYLSFGVWCSWVGGGT